MGAPAHLAVPSGSNIRLDYSDAITLINSKGSTTEWGDDLGAEQERVALPTVIERLLANPVARQIERTRNITRMASVRLRSGNVSVISTRSDLAIVCGALQIIARALDLSHSRLSRS